jgi:hypothetical protein
MPLPKQKWLTRREIDRLFAAERRIHDARLAWAGTIRRFGIAACARELGVTPQALGQRLQTVERLASEAGRRKRRAGY